MAYPPMALIQLNLKLEYVGKCIGLKYVGKCEVLKWIYYS